MRPVIGHLWSVSFLVSTIALLDGCARLPETTRVIQNDDRVVVRLETVVNVDAYSQGTTLDIPADQLAALLRGFSVRQVSSIPIRYLKDAQPPRKFLQEREIDALTPALLQALQSVGPDELIRFEVLSPGRNPRYWRDVTGGWIKVRHRYFHLAVDYFHVEQPVRKTDSYDPNYPSPWTPEQMYSVYFEPNSQFVLDPQMNSFAVDLSQFSSSAAP